MKFNTKSLSAAIAIGFALCSSIGSSAVLDIATLSTHADRVSGGDVLVQITSDASGAGTVTLNGVDVTSAFHPGTAANTVVGLLTGLNLGKNTLAAGGKSLVITNYSIKGPIVSGPYVQPFICQTQDFRLPDGTTLGIPIDVDCSAPTKIIYLYRPTDGTALIPLPSTSNLPANVAMTSTLTGLTVPFVVRLETGTMDRGIYQNAILRADAFHAAQGVEQALARSAWRRLPRRLVHPGRGRGHQYPDWHESHAPRRRLGDIHQHAAEPEHQLQRNRGRRSDDDG
ncbi:MAG: hypothetical protein E6H68_14520 [Betaproteobacteria bacterium]|nr:MAG: hypothetical protein E6H68_14520 [Betaproteobacteria bacterium]